MSPCSHIALLRHISTFLHYYFLYLFHSGWEWKGWTEKKDLFGNEKEKHKWKYILKNITRIKNNG